MHRMRNIVGEDDQDDLARENQDVEPEPRTEKQVVREKLRHAVNLQLAQGEGAAEEDAD